MKQCKAEDCNNKILEKRVYCSTSCRTRTTNKLFKDYKKSSNTRKQKNRKGYNKVCKNPNCFNEIPFEIRENKYCSHSCAAIVVNKVRLRKDPIFSEIGLENIRLASLKRFGVIKSHKNKVCSVCDSIFNGKNKYCSLKCIKLKKRRTCNILRAYRTDCKFTFGLSTYPNEFDFDLIRQHGWYAPSNRGNNINGVSRDHMFSIHDGFKQNVNPEIMRHPANCQLLQHSQNISKNKKSVITLDELLDRIKVWNQKYT